MVVYDYKISKDAQGNIPNGQMLRLLEYAVKFHEEKGVKFRERKTYSTKVEEIDGSAFQIYFEYVKAMPKHFMKGKKFQQAKRSDKSDIVCGRW